MPDVMMALGTEYQFSIDTAAYERLRHHSQYRWAEMQRVAHRVSLQFIGVGIDDIELHGKIFPGYKGGLGQLNSMREQAGKGIPLNLVSGYGEVLGRYCIFEIEEDQSVFAQRGAPRKVEFRLRLSRYGEDEETTSSSATVSATADPVKTLTVDVAATLPDTTTTWFGDSSGSVTENDIPDVTADDLSSHANAFKQAGIALQSAATTVRKAAATLALLATDAKALTAIGWNYARLAAGLKRDVVGTISSITRAVNKLGSARDPTAVALFGNTLAHDMTRFGSVFSLSEKINSETLALKI